MRVFFRGNRLFQLHFIRYHDDDGKVLTEIFTNGIIDRRPGNVIVTLANVHNKLLLLLLLYHKINYVTLKATFIYLTAEQYTIFYAT